jgi:hypothetical protein
MAARTEVASLAAEGEKIYTREALKRKLEHNQASD